MKIVHQDDNIRVCVNQFGEILVQSKQSAAQLRIRSMERKLEFTNYPRFAPNLSKDSRYGWVVY